MTITSTYSRNVIKSEFQANSFETGNQLAPDVTGLSNGGFAVAYNNGNINDGEVVVDFYDAAQSASATSRYRMTATPRQSASRRWSSSSTATCW